MSKISLAGWYPKLWIGWVLIVYGALVSLGYVTLRALADGSALDVVASAAIPPLGLSLLFLPLEVVGAWLNSRDSGDGEIARTFSQLMQYFAHRTPGHQWWRGWNGFVTINCAVVWMLISIATTAALLGLGSAVGVSGVALYYATGAVSGVLGLLGFTWNFHHWQQREKYG
jgi:hypothetical protein